MSWARHAQDLLDAMVASGVQVERKLIAPGPEAGIRCRTFLVYLDSPQALPAPLGRLAGNDGCTVVPTQQYQARFAADCFPPPADNGGQPDADKTTAATVAFLNEAQRVWQSIVDAAPSWGCRAVTVLPGEIAGPNGGVVTMTVPVIVQDDGLPI